MVRTGKYGHISWILLSKSGQNLETMRKASPPTRSNLQESQTLNREFSRIKTKLSTRASKTRNGFKYQFCLSILRFILNLISIECRLSVRSLLPDVGGVVCCSCCCCCAAGAAAALISEAEVVLSSSDSPFIALHMHTLQIWTLQSIFWFLGN